MIASGVDNFTLSCGQWFPLCEISVRWQCITMGKVVLRIIISCDFAIRLMSLTCLDSLHFNIKFIVFHVLSSINVFTFSLISSILKM
jgi:hypothetical protein